mmetsp:Transcript_17598/g.29492  ORF Transcript_17598/g.29492 Transcript_17598/m.29492 type:complete len:142 (+) Transcript_17598:181-606(+)|eukprot:CAMPEP_0114428750 /NCGR_PEP_ID=MMETSP0103-20121206/9104_1 /TAXON_ID=37642 ORGANISM="Paraphysomonas imperforata, Strain PA2" /NCGR_SAMPLE_ID=MMETSP0103 /ASSEMBLY_ACC=CAM_ASM_000201 /LENGTH=141 /DNA_ID=CAMNT_0001598011 /DNA_START=132 /DNA_END=557 /DNA_ORIENTATION=-
MSSTQDKISPQFSSTVAQVPDTAQSLLSEIIHWQTKAALLKRRKRLLLEEVYFAALDCEDEPRKKKKGDVFCGLEANLKASNRAAQKPQSEETESQDPQPSQVMDDSTDVKDTESMFAPVTEPSEKTDVTNDNEVQPPEAN